MNQNKLTEGSIIKSLLALSLPIVLANILQTAYQLTDTFWVGRLGTDAIAAVSISFPIVFLIISFGSGLAISGSILISHYKGRGDKNIINHIATQTFIGLVIFSVVFSVIGYLLSPWLITLMGANSGIIADATIYMKLSFVSTIFMFIYIAFKALFRGIGEVRMPMLIILGSVLLNLILDPLFIFGYGLIPAYGVVGAALATIITQGLSSVIGVIILLSGSYGIKLNWHNFRFDYKLIKKIFKIGFPASIEQSSRALGMVLMTILVATFGTFYLAVYGIGVRILSFIIIPAMGLSMATSVLVGQNIGAGRLSRAEEVSKLSALIAFVVLTIAGIILFIFAQTMAKFFVPNDVEAIKASAEFIRIMALSFGFIGTQMALNGTFRGSGNTIISMAMSVLSLFVLRLPIAYILSKYTSLSAIGVWWSFPISNILIAIIAIICFNIGRWKKKKIISD